jgi:hypothetical protein
MKTEVYDHVIIPMKALFTPPLGTVGDDERKIVQYGEALMRFDAKDLSEGWRRVVETYKRQFWPPIAVIVEACQRARTARLKAEPPERVVNGRVVDHAVQHYGGGCQCDQCRRKMRRPGFFVASADAYRAAELERDELARDTRDRLAAISADGEVEPRLWTG